MPSSVVKTKYFGKIKKSYLPLYAHTYTMTATKNKINRKITIYRFGKKKSASKYSGPLYSSQINNKKSQKTSKKKSQKTAKKQSLKRMKGGTISNMYDIAGNYRGSGGDSISPFGESTVPSGFVQNALNVYNGGATFPDTFLKDDTSPVDGLVSGGRSLTHAAILSDTSVPTTSMPSLFTNEPQDVPIAG